MITSAQDVDKTLPSVFMMGENPQEFENLIMTRKSLLVDVYENNMLLASERLKELLTAIDDYSEEIDFDIKGLKLWLHVFWNEDGTIEHLTYYPKPNSAKIEYNELTAFFKSFVNNHDSSMIADFKFAHQFSGFFPYGGKLNVKK